MSETVLEVKDLIVHYETAHDLSRRGRNEAEYGKRCRRFSRARFADESERLLFFQ